ncbi:MAG: helix-turn-helix domain-containing protein [Bacteroidota bacterium]
MMNSNKEQFVSIRPAHPLLQQHIAYYYFHSTFDPHFRRTFTYYPNYRVALNIFRHSDISWSGNKRLTLPDTSKKQTALLTFSTQNSRVVNMNGRIQKIGIIFEPLGFNHFIDVPAQRLISATINPFDFYGTTFFDMTTTVFEATSIAERRDVLDAFFLRHYRPFPMEELSLIIKDILRHNRQCSVQALAKSYNMSRRTLLRQFQNQLAHHIRGFSNLVRFRNTLQHYKAHQGTISLTQLAHDNTYYDQADFNKHIRAYTGLTPKHLFHQRREIGAPYTFWTEG